MRSSLHVGDKSAVRRAAAGLLAAVALVGAAQPTAAAPCWPSPPDAVVIDPYREPPCPFCAGNRGIEFEVPAGSAVRAVAPGRITFAGVIAGVGYAVVQLTNGWRITYGHVSTLRVRRGQAVITGQRIGESAGTLHLGVRVGERYVDPAPYLGRLIGRHRLVPLDRAARPAPARLSCASRQPPPPVGSRWQHR